MAHSVCTEGAYGVDKSVTSESHRHDWSRAWAHPPLSWGTPPRTCFSTNHEELARGRSTFTHCLTFNWLSVEEGVTMCDTQAGVPSA